MFNFTINNTIMFQLPLNQKIAEILENDSLYHLIKDKPTEKPLKPAEAKAYYEALKINK